MKFLEKWDQQLARLSEVRFYLALLVIMTASAAAVSIHLGLNMHRNFWTVACDTAAVQSAIVNTMHGNWFRDTAYDGPNLLGLHTMLVLPLITPIYALFPSTNTLFVLQILGVYSTVIPIYLIAVEVLQRPLAAFFIAVTALVCPMLLHMAVSPFHPETWIGAAVFWSYYFYLKNRATGFWVCLIFAVSCGEQASLIYVALGASWLLFDDGVAWRKRYGKFALAGGLGWLAFTFGVVSPLMRTPVQRNLFAYNYSDWGIQSVPGLIGALAQDPLRMVFQLIEPVHWFYVVTFVGIPFLLAFSSRRTLILLLPFPVYFLMSSREFFLYFHAYYFQFAFFAGYLGFIHFFSRWGIASRLGLTVLAITLVSNVLVINVVAGFYGASLYHAEKPLVNALHEVFATIPTDAGVFSPHRYSAFLSNRENMVMGDLHDENVDFDKLVESNFDATNVHADQIDYIVCDLLNDQCGGRFVPNGEDYTKRRLANIQRLVQSGKWQIFWNQDEVYILKRVDKE